MPEQIAPAVDDAFGDEVLSRIAFRGERFENIIQIVPEGEAVANEEKTLRFLRRRICLGRQGGLCSTAKRGQRREQQGGECEGVFHGLFCQMKFVAAFMAWKRRWVKR